MCYLLLATCYLLPVTCYLLFATCCLLPAICYLISVTCHSACVALTVAGCQEASDPFYSKLSRCSYACTSPQQARSQMQVRQAVLVVDVRPCVTSEYQQTSAMCFECSASTYSFDSSNSSCDSCPANANCTAGANLFPQVQFWHSAADSDWMVSCPNGNACTGDRDELLRCKKALYAAEATQTLVGTPPNAHQLEPAEQHCVDFRCHK